MCVGGAAFTDRASGETGGLSVGEEGANGDGRGGVWPSGGGGGPVCGEIFTTFRSRALNGKFSSNSEVKGTNAKL
jgi:hypothetical protein